MTCRAGCLVCEVAAALESGARLPLRLATAWEHEAAGAWAACADAGSVWRVALRAQDNAGAVVLYTAARGYVTNPPSAALARLAAWMLGETFELATGGAPRLGRGWRVPRMLAVAVAVRGLSHVVAFAARAARAAPVAHELARRTRPPTVMEIRGG